MTKNQALGGGLYSAPTVTKWRSFFFDWSGRDIVSSKNKNRWHYTYSLVFWVGMENDKVRFGLNFLHGGSSPGVFVFDQSSVSMNRSKLEVGPRASKAHTDRTTVEGGGEMFNERRSAKHLQEKLGSKHIQWHAFTLTPDSAQRTIRNGDTV